MILTGLSNESEFCILFNRQVFSNVSVKRLFILARRVVGYYMLSEHSIAKVVVAIHEIRLLAISWDLCLN